MEKVPEETNYKEVKFFKKTLFWVNWVILIESIKTILRWSLGIGFVILIYLVINGISKDREEERKRFFRYAQEDCYDRKGDCGEVFETLYIQLFSRE